MKFKKIHIIINPAAGSEEPILAYLNKAFINTDIEWDISITKKQLHAKEIATKLIGKTDLIVAYGGDGCVMEVAQALIGKKTPLAVLPGGTANVVAKELGIPIDTVAAIELLKSDNLVIKKIDTGIANGEPFGLRVNFGIMADMVTHTNRDMKDSLGQLAYGITTIQTLIDAIPTVYNMKIDGKKISEEGVFMTITNFGNIGIGGYSILPNISIADGFFDIILLDHADFSSILRVAGSTFLKTESEVLKRWKCKEVVINFDKSQKYLCDDVEREASEIKIKIVPSSLHIVVPIEKTI